MPIYNYECSNCQHADTEYQKMSEGHLTECPECKAASYHRVPSLAHTNLVEFHKPIELYSIGLSDDEEIRAFKAKCPDVDVSTDQNDPMYGVPIARSRAQKKDALDAMGFVETN